MSGPSDRAVGALATTARSGRVDGYAPIQAVTGRLTYPVHDSAVNFVQIGFVRRGALEVKGRFGSRQAQRGEVISLGTRTRADVLPGPEGAEYTTLFVDGQLLCDCAAWEFPTLLRGRSDGESYYRRRFPEGCTWARIGELALRELEPLLDELVELTRRGQLPRRFKRALAILFTVLDVIGRDVSAPETALPPQPSDAPTRLRPLQQLRPEVDRVIALIESDLARTWRMDELAATVGLSAGHLRQLFSEGLGTTPPAHQNQLRAKRAQELLLDRSRSIPDVMAEIGWTSPSHWTTMFRRHTGMTPRQYRERT